MQETATQRAEKERRTEGNVTLETTGGIVRSAVRRRVGVLHRGQAVVRLPDEVTTLCHASNCYAGMVCRSHNFPQRPLQ